ncbi:MAG: CHAT domain-containing protein [Ardenticatenaceae bacterium]
MRRDCIIEWPAFDPEGDQLELKIIGIPQTPDGKQVIRRFLSIERQELDQLRAGNPPDALVEKLTDQVSEWLQEPDLDLAQLLKLHEANGPTWRLVFSVPNMRDEKLPFDLSNIPIELIRPKGLTIPFALHNRVSSIVHLLPKVGKASAPSATTWPLRILIVRSSPKDLHVKVPEAAPIRETILALWPDLGPFLQVDYLSSETEANVAGPPTREKLIEQLGFGYDILVYLGHGDVAETQDERMPIGQLLLETVDRYTDRLEAPKLSDLLHNRPVPVVLLVGCLTAAELEPEIEAELEKEIPNWWRGSQGVAQALINSSTSGVQFVVGMRYRIEVDDAILFLKAFFESLLGAKPNERFGNSMGNLELAVREAREQLNLLGQQEISWAAPVLFRTQEPTLHFLSSPPLYHIKPELQEYRTAIWKSLSEVNWSMRSAAKRIVGMLQGVENEILNDVRNNKASLLMPRRVEINPDLVNPLPAETIVDVVVELHRTMQVKELEGTLVEGSGVGHFLMLTPSPALEDAGFDFWLSPTHNNQIKFLIRWPESGEGTLPQGILFRATLAIGDAIQVVYPLNLTDLKADPPRPLCPGNNAIIVPAP